MIGAAEVAILNEIILSTKKTLGELVCVVSRFRYNTVERPSKGKTILTYDCSVFLSGL